MTAVAELDDRIDKCQRLLDTDPNSQIFAALAEAFRKKGQLDKAFRVCQGGLKVHPSYASAHVVMSKINLDRGLYDWAEAEVRKAIEIEGPTRVNELLLAEIQMYGGNFDSATRLLKRLHQSDPGNEHIKKLLDIAKKAPEEQAKAVSEQPAPVTTPPAGTPAVAVPRISSKEVLELAMSIPHVTGALFVNPDGLVSESEWSLEQSPTVTGATLSEVHLALSQEMVKSSFGTVRTILIETGDPVFYLVRVSRGSFVFQGTSGINLGTLRMRISTLLEKYDDGR